MPGIGQFWKDGNTTTRDSEPSMPKPRAFKISTARAEAADTKWWQEAAEEGAQALKGGSLTKFEKLCDDAVEDYLSAAQYVPFGEAPLVGYLAARETEYTNLRILLMGRGAGLDPEVIRSRARFVVSRAARDVHAKFLLRNGADDVIYPERQMASWAAVRYSSDHIFDYIELTSEYSIYETEVPDAWIGKTIVQLAVRQKYKLNILATKHEGELTPIPGPDHVFRDDETLLILGHKGDIQTEVIVQTRAAIHEQGGRDTVQVQTNGQAVLKLQMDQLNGTLKLIVGEQRVVPIRDNKFTHKFRIILYCRK